MSRLEQAKLDPSSVYSQPNAVIQDDSLSDSDKIDILRRWAYDQLELMVAEEENMAGSQDNDCLDQILRALHQLGATIEINHPGASKHGEL